MQLDEDTRPSRCWSRRDGRRPADGVIDVEEHGLAAEEVAAESGARRHRRTRADRRGPRADGRRRSRSRRRILRHQRAGLPRRARRASGSIAGFFKGLLCVSLVLVLVAALCKISPDIIFGEISDLVGDPENTDLGAALRVAGARWPDRRSSTGSPSWQFRIHAQKFSQSVILRAPAPGVPPAHQARRELLRPRAAGRRRHTCGRRPRHHPPVRAGPRLPPGEQPLDQPGRRCWPSSCSRPRTWIIVVVMVGAHAPRHLHRSSRSRCAVRLGARRAPGRDPEVPGGLHRPPRDPPPRRARHPDPEVRRGVPGSAVGHAGGRRRCRTCTRRP